MKSQPGSFVVVYLSTNAVYFYTGTNVLGKTDTRGKANDLGQVRVFDSYEEAETVAKEFAANRAYTAAWVAKLESKAQRTTPPVAVTLL